VNVFLALLCIAAYIVYKRSSEIITVNPMSQVKPSAPDFAAIVNTVSEIAKQAAEQQNTGGARLPSSPNSQGRADSQGRAAIVRMVKNNQFIEAIQLYKRIYGVDLATAKKAVDEIMLNQ
jgi:hypothetical protein